MTVKILLDPILTAAPSGCSTNIQFYTLVNYVLEELKRTDVFFYWRVPSWVTEEEMEFYPKHPNVRYVFCDQHQNDRVQEYFRYDEQLEKHTNFYGDLWDFDILITVRSCLVGLFKMHMTSPRHRDMPWAKEVWLIEEMPMFDFKGTVPVTDERAQEMQTLVGHANADRLWLMSYHEHHGILDAARQYLSASEARKLRDKIKNVIPMQIKEFGLKKPEFFTEDKPFCMAFVGRMEKAQAQLDELNDLMVKSWIQKGEKVKLLACTVSRVIKSFDESLVEVHRYPRDEFWRVMREETHVVVSFGKEMGFSLSLLEPIALGTPAIVLKRPYVIPLLGEDYPFYIDSVSQAPGMLEWMYRNYPTCYAQFAEWHKTKLRPMYEQMYQTDLMYPLIVQAIDDYKTNVQKKFVEKKSGKANNAIVQLIAEHGGQEFTMPDLIRELDEKGLLNHLSKKLEDKFTTSSSLPWLPTWNEQRLALKHLLGWEDASTTVGHMRKKS